MPDDPDLSDDANDDNAVIRTLRQKAERTDLAESEVADLKRELVVHKAGLTDLSDKQLKALTAAHEGDWTPEDLKATAVELGFGPQPVAEPPPTGNDPAEMAAMQRTQAASGGTPQPVLQGDDALKASLAEAWDSPEAIVAALRNADRLVE